MNLNFLNNKSSKLNIKSNLWLVTLLLVIVGISFSCKKYTKDEERYRITVVSDVPLEKVLYRLKKNSGEALILGPEAGGINGGLGSLNKYEYVLDTNLLTQDLYRFDISAFFDMPPTTEFDVRIKCVMVRTKTNEVLFEEITRGVYKTSKTASFFIHI